MRIRLASLATTVILAGCAPPIPDGGFNAPDPASRAYALIHLVRNYRGPNAIHTGVPPARTLEPVVAMLDSDDPMERFMASQALRDLTGQDMGYQPADPLPLRAQAVEGWRAWLQGRSGATASDQETRPT